MSKKILKISDFYNDIHSDPDQTKIPDKDPDLQPCLCVMFAIREGAPATRQQLRNPYYSNINGRTIAALIISINLGTILYTISIPRFPDDIHFRHYTQALDKDLRQRGQGRGGGG